MNRLFYGDNLDVLRRHVDKESIDLVYLDPPFNSAADYNAFFTEQDGSRSAAQIRAFEDTWRWDQGAAAAYGETLAAGGRVADCLRGLRAFLGETDMLAYLAMMAPRLVELRRVLKTTGSIYLHCDPTASHYLKVLMDGVFGPRAFANEIIWQRTLPKGLATRRLATNHDVIIAYRRSDDATWDNDAAFEPYDPDDLSDETLKQYSQVDEDGRRYQLTSLLNPNNDRPNLTYEFLGVKRVWRWTRERMEAAFKDGLVVQTAPGNVPRLKRFLDKQRGRPLGDVWTDISPLIGSAQERLGYPTQKPEALLERIVRLSSREGDVVLDPFCGCGTAIAVAERLNRQWIGIDVTHLAITLMKKRLRDAFGDKVQFKVIGEPEDLTGARALADSDQYQFQWWALGLVGARPAEEKKGADKGIDGRLYFHDDATGRGDTKQIIFSVKAGNLTAAHVRDLRGVVEREKAAIGVLLSMDEPTKPMRAEAASADLYASPWGTRHPRLQLLTVGEILAGKRVDFPAFRQTDRTFKTAPKAGPDVSTEIQRTLGGVDLAADDERAEDAPRSTAKPKRAAKRRGAS